MTLVLRLTWPKREEPDDYEVWDGDQAVGRMYLARPTMGLGNRWMWRYTGSRLRAGRSTAMCRTALRRHARKLWPSLEPRGNE